MAATATETKLAYLPIFAGAQMDVVTKTVTIASGTGKLKAGSVVGMTDADSKCILCAKDATDGSQEVYGIVLGDVDATSADACAVVAITGEFVADSLTFGADTTAVDVALQAEARNIYFRNLINKEA